MDKYDLMIESARNYREEDYLSSVNGDELSKEEQIRQCWDEYRGKGKFMPRSSDR